MGCQSWPDEPIFTHCSHCGELTRRVTNIEPDIDRDEATNIKLHDLFERYYEKRCLKLGIPVDGPLPDEAEIE